MTAAIGQRFSQVPAAPPSGGVAGARGTDDGDATAFGDLVHEKRGTRGAPPRSGEAKAVPGVNGRNHHHAGSDGAESAAGGRETGRTHHTRKTDDRDSNGDKGNDEHRPEAAVAGDVQPLRDRLPLLATLNELGHRGAAPATKSGRKPEGMSQASTSAGAVDGTATKNGDRTGANLPDDAGKQTAEHNSPTVDTILSVMESDRPLKAAAAVASPAGPQGRQAESNTPSSGTTTRPLASKNAVDGLTGVFPAMALQTGPADGSQDGASPDAQDSLEDGRAGPARAGRWARDESSQEPDRVSRIHTERRASGSVNVAADRSFPAPAVHPLNHTTAGVIDALAAMGNQAPASALSQHPQAAPVAHQAQLLRIELHPAELGMVTASLRMSGEQLSIELKPETAEAYRRLAHDSDTIVKSLRKLGLDVDSVTVMQPSIATQPAVRVDAGNQSTALPDRGAGQFQPGTSGGSGDGSAGHQSGRNRNHDGQPLDRPAPVHRERARGSLFI